MSFQSDLVAALAESTRVSEIVGERIFSDVADGTAAAPYIVYQVVYIDGETAHDGSRGICFPVIRLSCWAASRAAAINLSSAVIDLLDGKTVYGDSDLSLVFSSQFSSWDQETNLFSEVIELQGHCNQNQPT